MADDLAPACAPHSPLSPPPPPPPPVAAAAPPPPPYSVNRGYTISQRIALLTAYREWVQSMGARRSISAQALADIIDDVFLSFGGWLSIEDPLFKTVYRDALDPNTVRNFLKCELGLNVRKMHVKSFRIIDAFLQIVRDHPPLYL